jgi:hypothetical protein
MSPWISHFVALPLWMVSAYFLGRSHGMKRALKIMRDARRT